MKKKFIRVTAMLLSAAMALTACGSGAGSDDDSGLTREEKKEIEKELSVYMEAEVTEVTDEPYTVNGREGLYTGGWKGNRPEGEGTLTFSSDPDFPEYYKGEWVNGALNGYSEVWTISDDGSVNIYYGECTYNNPSGEGILATAFGLETDSDGDGTADTYEIYVISVEGDFSDESTLMYFMTNEDTSKLYDIGYVENGEYVSYVQNPNLTGGIAIYDWIDRYCGYGDMNFAERCDGTYYGETDENGVPNGFGYCETPYNHSVVYKLGTWKDGKIDGYYTELWTYNGEVGEKRMGYKRNAAENYGDFVKIETLGRGTDNARCVVTRQNFEDAYTYVSCGDGISKTGPVVKEIYYADGTSEYQEYVTVRRDSDAKKGDNWKYYYSGEYYKFDADGNVTEGGTADEDYACTLRWVSYSQSLKNQIMDVVAPIAAVMILGYIGYKVYDGHCDTCNDPNSGVNKYLDRVKAENAASVEQHRKYKELIDQAEEELENGDTYEANKLYDEAKKLGDSAWW